MTELELKVLLQLLGFSNYRASLSKLRVGKDGTTGRSPEKVCLQLRDRGWLGGSEVIIRLKATRLGRGLLKRQKAQFSLTDAERRVLVRSAEQAISPSRTGLGSAERQSVLQHLAQQGLIAVQTRLKEVWLTEAGTHFLRDQYQPRGSSTISLTLLGNYLALLRQTPQVAPKPSERDLPDDQQILQTIQQIDRETGSQNYLPLFQLRRQLQPPLSREELDRSLYRLQRQDLIELSTLQDMNLFTPDEIEAGIPQDIGGPLFFVIVL